MNAAHEDSTHRAKRFVSSIWVLTIGNALLNGLVALLCHHVALEAFEQGYGIYAKYNNIPATAQIPDRLKLLAGIVGAALGVIFFVVLETSLIVIYLHNRILLAVEGEEALDEDDGLLDRIFPYDPVDEKTVQYLLNHLNNLADYFGSITHVSARRWFAGDNYFTLLLYQVRELINRKLNRYAKEIGNTSQESELKVPSDGEKIEIFRIIVWPKRAFCRKQSIALLRILHFFSVEVAIPLKTVVLSKEVFDKLMKHGLSYITAREFEGKGQFWICNCGSTASQNEIAFTMVWGQKRRFWPPWRRTEIPQVENDQTICRRCKSILGYVRSFGVPLEDIFKDINIYDDETVKRHLRDALKKLDSKEIVGFETVESST